MDAIRKPFEFSFKMIKFQGCWIENGDNFSLKQKVRSILTIILCPMMFDVLLCFGLIKNGISLDSINSVTFIVACTVVNARIIDFIVQRKNVQILYQKTLNIMEKSVKKSQLIEKRMNFYFKLFIGNIANTYVSLTAGFFVSFLTHEYPYPIAIPFNLDSSEIGFTIVNIYLLIVLIFTAPTYSLLGMYPMFFMNFLIGFMEEFNEKLENFGKITAETENHKEYDELVEKEFLDIVETYEEIKEYVKEFTKIYEFSFFVKQIAASIILCTAVFTIPLVSLNFFIYITFINKIFFYSKKTSRKSHKCHSSH